MTSAKEKAYKLRHLILVVGIIFTLLGFAWASFGSALLGTVLVINKVVADEKICYVINSIIVIGIVLLAQWAFLRPGKNFKVRLTTEGRPLKSSVFAAALMSMLLTTGLISLLLEFPDWWEDIMDADSPIVIASVYITMFIIWAIWAWIFFVYWKQGDRYTQSGKMIRGLVAGTILEIMVAVPVQIWATRQRDCYCCRGSYTTLILASTVLVWAFGPGIILLYMREKHRRGKLIENETLTSEKTSEDTS